MREIQRKTITMYQADNGECPVVSWLESLDSSTRYRIKSRLARVALGNLGDYKMLGNSLGELRFKFGAGYRIYFGEINGEIILLLCGGDKGTQKKDIKIARHYLDDYLQGDNHGQKH